jgi:hypothetical protein
MRQNNRRGVVARSRLRKLATGAAVAAMLMPLPALAGPPGCKSITKGTLDVTLPAGQRSSRMVRLNEGETINFSVHGGASGATVTLVSGGSSPQTLSSGGSMASYAAPASATYVFAIEAAADSMTAVSASCSKTAGTAAAAPTVKEVQVAQIVDDMNGTRGSAFSLGLSEFAAAAEAAMTPVDRWADAADKTAVAIDTAEGQEDVSAATLSLSASAEVGPDDVSVVLARMDRIATTDSAAEQETSAALASAVVGSELSFEPEATAPAKRSGKATTVVARAVTTQSAPEELWVTHLHEDRSAESAVTETAVLRRDTVVADGALPPPMALGALIPADADAAPPATGFAP